jgi:tripartite-type tricarboxylate transporter receptor subunit TctC
MPSHAAGFPERPVRLIVPFPPSGGTDIVARLLAQRLTESFRQQFVIDNRPGAASTIGANIAAKAAPDGYTLLFVTASFAIAAGYYKSLPYDSVKDFTGVSLIASGPLALVIHPSVKSGSVAELVSLAKSAPLTLHYASGGAGGINHLAGELFNSIAGTQIVHVPYKGAGPALTAVISGEAQMMIATVASILPHLKSGKLRALATAGERRTSILPDLPTLSESGLRGYSADNWYALLAPRGTDRSVIAALSRHIADTMRRDDAREQLLKLGFEPMTSTPDELNSYLRREIAKWSGLIKASRLQLEATP